MKVEFKLTGLTALLMHNDDVQAADMLTAWRQDPKNKEISKAGDDRSPAWTWQTYLYHDGENIALPSANLMVCLRSAATKMILKGKKTYKEVSQSGMQTFDEYLDFSCNGGSKTSRAALHDLRDRAFEEQSDAVRDFGFRLFVKRAKIGRSKHIRVRPRFDKWSVSGTIEVQAQELTFEVLEQMFSLAGRIGLCDWRPGCQTPGPFGMFETSLIKLA